MKRAFAITLTVAMIGALAFMGFAGTAAAHQKAEPVEKAEPVVVEQQPQVSQTANSDMVQVQEGDQVNVNQPEAEINQGQAAGVGLAAAEATGGDWTVEVTFDGDGEEPPNDSPIIEFGEPDNNGDGGAFSAGDATATAVGIGVADNVTQTQDATIDQSNEQNNIAVQDGTSTATNILG
ncbi:hypothetical protein [Natrarchaeobaculum aegyptiacum]|uniref:Uncharacterized protein n=1 Tax=Natrarchaeobaculum aegyptiacum TaxID=745377 RepID=A0A2Z2HVA6_9EURY|nr:hypothetical protein [Natrarchaeobaculum aegyptiacum]ARS91236.1 hypothetical protein B1756_16875 [Natrarchaeobaculum aegyptiacum]